MGSIKGREIEGEVAVEIAAEVVVEIVAEIATEAAVNCRDRMCPFLFLYI